MDHSSIIFMFLLYVLSAKRNTLLHGKNLIERSNNISGIVCALYHDIYCLLRNTFYLLLCNIIQIM